MATPTFNQTGYMSLISAADATGSGWSIDDTDTDIKVEGLGSHYDAIRNGGTLTFTFGASQDMSATNVHIRLWMQHTFPSYLQTKALGGIQLFVSDGTNTAYWYVGGSDTHNGSWELFQADLSATPNSGTTPTLSTITSFGFVLDHATAARNVVNTYWDISWYGIGIEFYGGTSGDKVAWSDVAIADTGTTSAKQYGITELIKGGAYYLNHAVFVGDSIGTNDTYFDGTNETIVFYAANEKSGTYKISAIGNATGTTSVDLSGTSIISASTPFIFDMDSVNLTTLTMNGANLKNSSACYFKSGQTISGTKFTDCTIIYPNSATLSECDIIDSLVSTSVLSVLSGCSFQSSGTGHGVNLGTVTSTQSMSWDNNDSGYTASSSGNETILVSVDSGQTLTINVGSGYTTPSVYNTGLGTVNVVSGQVTTKVTVKDLDTLLVISGARVLVWVTDDTNFPYNASVTITGTGTTATVAHTAHGLASSDNIIIEGAVEDVYNGAYPITVTGVDSYTYTTNETITISPATGTITATFAFINGDTDALGVISDSRTVSSNQPILGRIRKSSASPFYKQGSISGTVDNATGFSTTVQLVSDE